MADPKIQELLTKSRNELTEYEIAQLEEYEFSSGPPLHPPDGREIAHAGAHLYSLEPQAAGTCQGFRQALQHGARECERDVDRDAQISRWKEGPTGQQG
ncbi:uncharacterized protein TrAtP1_011339 [Trichoderma atroviride]|uniref:uncharacterized protein n=1 Tax=Hypocrea atroviridis TaxID=63577 RepID=UPI0033263EBF|nr:hypothetical protein TrAtP1_011339 [Trichoderma atroviride]